jgi:hypothetical protein
MEDGKITDTEDIKNNPLVNYATEELKIAGWLEPNHPQENEIAKDVMELIEAFAKQGHSGSSAPLVLAIFDKLAHFSPLTPLTGKDSEWVHHTESEGQDIYQNRRYPAVFKKKDGKAYDLDGIVFVNSSGVAFTTSESKVYINFPYMPNTTFIREGTPEAEPYKHVFQESANSDKQ